MPLLVDLDITLDLAIAQRSAERVRDRLLDLRKHHDLARFEYSKQIRIAPTEITHSHPKITLNTWVRDDLALLSTYLHEQMHWYVTWYSHAHVLEWRETLRRLRERYPMVPVGGAEGAQDEFSTYAHLLINWLEVEAVAQFVDREQVAKHVRELPFYRWIYQTVIDEWEPLGAMYVDQGLLPFRFATRMSSDDLRLAALAVEESV